MEAFMVTAVTETLFVRFLGRLRRAFPTSQARLFAERGPAAVGLRVLGLPASWLTSQTSTAFVLHPAPLSTVGINYQRNRKDGGNR